MKPTIVRPWRILNVVAALAGLPLTCQAAVLDVGTGPDTSYLILQSPQIGLREYAVHYTYDPGVPIGTLDLLDIVDAAEPMLSFLNAGSVENAFIFSLTWNGITEAATSSPPFIYWAQWVAGGQAGAEFDPPFAPAPVAIANGSWSFGAGASAPYRIIEPGSSDALVYGDGSLPSFAPIPEPSIALLMILAIPGSLFLRFRS